MLLTTALLRSLSGIATRREEKKFKSGNSKYTYHFAVASGRVNPRSVIHVINGTSGAIRRIEAVDQLRTDWEPFQEIPGKPKK